MTPTAMSAGTTSNTVPAGVHVAVDVRTWTLEEIARRTALLATLFENVLIDGVQ